MNEKTIKRLQALPRVLIENGITYYIIPQEEYEKLKDKEQEVKKAKDKIDYMKEYIQTVEHARNDLKRELEQKEQECERLKKTKKATEEASELFVKNADEIARLLENKLDQFKQTLDEIEEFCIVYSSNHDAYETVYKHILEIINKAKEQ